MGAAVASALFLFLRLKEGTFHRARIEALQKTIQEISDDLQTTRDEKIRLEAEKEVSERADKERANMEEMLIGKFENLSHKIFDEKNETFKRQSKESLGTLLSPLQNRLNDFQKRMEESFGAQAKEQFSLKKEIETIVTTNQNLTTALKGDSKVQGNWGEMVLEKILEDSGLRKGTDYTAQAPIKDADGRLQKPDIVVNLPKNKHIIIDSKVSLTHYERYMSAEEDSEKALYLKQFLDSVKVKIGELDQRRYQDTQDLGTPDFVLMFVPIEAAYILAIQENPALQEQAWHKKVVLVCPTTLFATLRTVASVWRLEMQHKNVEKIAQEGGLLYDKIEGFVDDMQKIGNQLGTVSNTYDKAMNKLSTGRGNILAKTEKLKELGAKTSKSLPANLLDKEVDEDIEIIEDHTDQAA